MIIWWSQVKNLKRFRSSMQLSAFTARSSWNSCTVYLVLWRYRLLLFEFLQVVLGGGPFHRQRNSEQCRSLLVTQASISKCWKCSRDHITNLLNTGAPQGRALSLILYTVYARDCTLVYSLNAVMKFADNATVDGLVLGGDEFTYSSEIYTAWFWTPPN